MVFPARGSSFRGHLREDGANLHASNCARHLDDFVEEEKIPMDGAQLYSHVLPSPQAQTIRRRRIVGTKLGHGRRRGRLR